MERRKVKSYASGRYVARAWYCLAPRMGVGIILIRRGGPKQIRRLAPEHHKKKFTPFFYARSSMVALLPDEAR